MFPRRRLNSWINRRGFRIRKGIILLWIFLGHFLVMGYKTTLLSSLIQIRYGSTIDTLEDMAKSGLPLLIPSHTTLHKLIASDPRPLMKEIYRKSHLTPILVNRTVDSRLGNM